MSDTKPTFLFLQLFITLTYHLYISSFQEKIILRITFVIKLQI